MASGTAKIGSAARAAEGSRRLLVTAWQASHGPWNDVRREHLGRRDVEPLLEEAARYNKALAEAARKASAALSML